MTYASQPHGESGEPLSLILWHTPAETVGVDSQSSLKTLKIAEPQSKCAGGDAGIRESYLQKIIAFLDTVDQVDDIPQKEGYKQYSADRNLR
mmetsp:Transcript_2108/g.4046  ORF Transcript_2108/g.4046 Transcript_2108/m.4046 type:complete len:92 (-) Transcript_2108:136-411(-)